MLISLLVVALGFTPIQPGAMFADYVLNVPVRIDNMRNLTSATLNCDIWHIGTTPSDRYALGTPGTGSVAVPLSGGSYSGTLTATVTVAAATALQHPPTTWNCILIFRWRNPDGTEYNESPTTNVIRATAYTTITGQEITTNTTEISGPIPPA